MVKLFYVLAPLPRRCAVALNLLICRVYLSTQPFCAINVINSVVNAIYNVDNAVINVLKLNSLYKTIAYKNNIINDIFLIKSTLLTAFTGNKWHSKKKKLGCLSGKEFENSYEISLLMWLMMFQILLQNGPLIAYIFDILTTLKANLVSGHPHKIIKST